MGLKIEASVPNIQTVFREKRRKEETKRKPHGDGVRRANEHKEKRLSYIEPGHFDTL